MNKILQFLFFRLKNKRMLKKMSSSGSNNESDSYNPSVIELNVDGSNEQEVFTNLMRICKSYHYTDVLAIAV
jgi:hypothetical protein